MNLITVITKRSIREVTKEKRFLKFFSSKNYAPGDVIEIIDGGKKSPAIILKLEDISNLKQQLRKGPEMLHKFKFSKSGANANGVVVSSHDFSEIKKYIKDPLLAQTSDEKFLKTFFPKKKLPTARKKEPVKRENKMSAISFDQSDIFKEKKYHNKMQEQVDRIRTYFGEKSTYGIGSFSYYIGFFKNIPYFEIDQMFAEAKQSRKPLKQQYKIFWWKIGQYMKNKNAKK